MPKVRFSSDDLPAALSDQARFEAWQKFYAGFYTSLDMQPAKGRPFAVTFAAAQIGNVRLGRIIGTFSEVTRTASGIASAQNNDYLIALNLASARLFYAQADREVTLEPGAAVLRTNAETGVVRAEDVVSWMFVGYPRQEFDELCQAAVDLIGRPFDPQNPALRQLERYVSMLLGPDDIADEPSLTSHIETSLYDLASLACNLEREMAPIVGMTPARAAQFRDVVKEIKASYLDPDFSPDGVCGKLKLSPRHLQALLAESGASSTERVMELRLQKARTLLGQAGNQHKISDIAFQAGFNEVSYFNRCFRRRFGVSPTQYRAAN
jgi:AraC-like DNA-binding protein